MLFLWALALSAEVVVPRWGHVGGVRNVAADPAGRVLVSGGYDGTIRVWAGDDGALLHAWWSSDDAFAWDLAVDPAGERLAVPTRSPGELWVVRIADGATVARFDAPEVPNQVVFSRDGTRLYSASTDGIVRTRTLDGGTSNALTVCPRGTWLGEQRVGADGTGYMRCKNRSVFTFDAVAGTTTRIRGRIGEDEPLVAVGDGSILRVRNGVILRCGREARCMRAGRWTAPAGYLLDFKLVGDRLTGVVWMDAPPPPEPAHGFRVGILVFTFDEVPPLAVHSQALDGGDAWTRELGGRGLGDFVLLADGGVLVGATHGSWYRLDGAGKIVRTGEPAALPDHGERFALSADALRVEIGDRVLDLGVALLGEAPRAVAVSARCVGGGVIDIGEFAPPGGWNQVLCAAPAGRVAVTVDKEGIVHWWEGDRRVLDAWVGDGAWAAWTPDGRCAVTEGVDGIGTRHRTPGSPFATITTFAPSPKSVCAEVARALSR